MTPPTQRRGARSQLSHPSSNHSLSVKLRTLPGADAPVSAILDDHGDFSTTISNHHARRIRILFASTMTNYGTDTASVGIFGVNYQYRYSGCVPVCDWRSFQPINKFATHGKQEYEDTMVTATPRRTQASNTSCLRLMNQPKMVRKIPEVWIMGATTDTGAIASAIKRNI